MLQASKGYHSYQEKLDKLWQSCGDAMYSITEREKQLGMKNMVRTCIDNCRVQFDGLASFRNLKY